MARLGRAARHTPTIHRGRFFAPGPVEETITNVAFSDQNLLSAEAQAANQSGSGSFTTADSTAESKTNVATSSQTILDSPALIDALVNLMVSSQTILQALAESDGNSGTGSQSQSEATAESDGNSAASSQTIAQALSDAEINLNNGAHTVSDATADTRTNTQLSTQSFLEGSLDSLINSALAILAIVLDATSDSQESSATGSITESPDSTGDGVTTTQLSTQTLDEQITGGNQVTDTLTNVGTSDQSLLSAEAQAAIASGSGSFTTADATSETDTNTETSTQTIGETILVGIFDTLVVTGTSVHTLLSAEAQAANQSGAGSFITADATSETRTNQGTGSITLSDGSADTLSVSAQSTNTLANERLAEGPINSGTGTPIYAESTTLALNTATSTHTLLEDIQVFIFVVPPIDLELSSSIESVTATSDEEGRLTLSSGGDSADVESEGSPGLVIQDSPSSVEIQ